MILFDGEDGSLVVKVVDRDAKVIELNERCELDLRLLAWYDSTKRYYVCGTREVWSSVHKLNFFVHILQVICFQYGELCRWADTTIISLLLLIFFRRS
jgi:hypothetical protein